MLQRIIEVLNQRTFIEKAYDRFMALPTRVRIFIFVTVFSIIGSFKYPFITP